MCLLLNRVERGIWGASRGTLNRRGEWVLTKDLGHNEVRYLHLCIFLGLGLLNAYAVEFTMVPSIIRLL